MIISNKLPPGLAISWLFFVNSSGDLLFHCVIRFVNLPWISYEVFVHWFFFFEFHYIIHYNCYITRNIGSYNMIDISMITCIGTINTIDIHIINSRCAGITVDNKQFGNNNLKITHQWKTSKNDIENTGKKGVQKRRKCK